MKYRTAFVPAPASTFVTEGLFFGQREEVSVMTPDGPRLAQMCQDVCNQFDSEGYDIVSINEVVRGNTGSGSRISSDSGWSMTQGFVITARRRS